MPGSVADEITREASVAEHRLSASFRDPAGYVFRRDHTLYRRVTPSGTASYYALMRSGLYEELTDPSAKLLVRHEEVTQPDGSDDIVLRPEPISLISYPYEWCFSQLQDAAIATLEIQRRALDRGLWLKDASSYNIQFHEGRPVLIDTLSFEEYREGRPWPAYKQFCQHFLAPLALMSHVDAGLGQLMRVHLDGIPLALASKLLPFQTRFKPGLLTHIHLHAAAQGRSATAQGRSGESPAADRDRSFVSRQGLLGILDTLRGTVAGLRYESRGTTWDRYYSQTNYSDSAMEDKTRIVASFLDSLSSKPTTAWDLGANNGRFSRLCTDRGIPTVAWDIDHAAVEQNWRECKARAETQLLPLVQDLTNPSPSLGWAEAERDGFVERGRGRNGIVLALALIHHLAIANSLPLSHIAHLFANLCAPDGHLIVEWVPAEDSQAQRLLASRDGGVPGYGLPDFRAAFDAEFAVVSDVSVAGTQRRLYLMRRRPGTADPADSHFAVSSRSVWKNQDDHVSDTD